MRYANGIGRVGGLAVALGVGMALANSGVAVADSGDSPVAGASGDTTVSKSGSARGTRKSSPPAAPAASNNTAPAPKASATAALPKRSGIDNAVARSSATSVAARSSVPVSPVTTAAPAVAVPDAAAPAAAATTSSPRPTYAQRRPAAVAARTTANPMASAGGPAQWLSSVLSPLFGSGPSNNQTLTPLMWSVAAFTRRDFAKAPRTAGASTTASTTLTMSPNLLLNPGAEVGDPSLSGNSAVTIPGWTLTGTPTVIAYGTPRNLWPMGLAFPTPNLPSFMGFPKKPPTGTPETNTQFFGGGNVATATLTQIVDLGSPAVEGVTYNLSAYLGGYLFDPSSASVKVDFLDANKTYLGSNSIGPVSVFERFFQTGFKQRTATGTLPTDTQYAQVTLNLVKKNPQMFGFQADYNAAFADDISFTVSADLPAPGPVTPPESRVGELDHVFMVYMENKGYDDIVGSPNAPFLNSLINAYGFATNYFGLTHPSLPNYYPILGGSDFGKTYNCKDACIDAPITLMENLDDAGLTWRSYAQGFEDGMNPLTSQGDYAVDATAFPAYTYFAQDLNYAKEHLVPLEQMAIDLESVETTPNYAWFAADEDSNGEGPVDFPWGMLKFAWSQISPGHQYNVPALDAYLASTVPTILNSVSWKTDTAENTNKSALFITFDEDNNNTSLGFGNEGNHIVTVVIPNKDAIDSGMRAGAFIDGTHYNHYSLLRTIEEALGLDPMTNNDRYAVPMNGFWDTIPPIL